MKEKITARICQITYDEKEMDDGMIPFEFAVSTGDYWPDMRVESEEINWGLNKTMYVA